MLLQACRYTIERFVGRWTKTWPQKFAPPRGAVEQWVHGQCKKTAEQIEMPFRRLSLTHAQTQGAMC